MSSGHCGRFCIGFVQLYVSVSDVYSVYTCVFSKKVSEISWQVAGLAAALPTHQTRTSPTFGCLLWVFMADLCYSVSFFGSSYTPMVGYSPKLQTKAHMASTVMFSFAHLKDQICVSLQSRLTALALYSSVMANQTNLK